MSRTNSKMGRKRKAGKISTHGRSEKLLNVKVEIVPIITGVLEKVLRSVG